MHLRDNEFNAQYVIGHCRRSTQAAKYLSQAAIDEKIEFGTPRVRQHESSVIRGPIAHHREVAIRDLTRNAHTVRNHKSRDRIKMEAGRKHASFESRSNLLKIVTEDFFLAALVHAHGNEMERLHFVELIQHEYQRIARLRRAEFGQLLGGLEPFDSLPNQRAGVIVAAKCDQQRQTQIVQRMTGRRTAVGQVDHVATLGVFLIIRIRESRALRETKGKYNNETTRENNTRHQQNLQDIQHSKLGIQRQMQRRDVQKQTNITRKTCFSKRATSAAKP